jgi:hypothetical protein
MLDHIDGYFKNNSSAHFEKLCYSGTWMMEQRGTIFAVQVAGKRHSRTDGSQVTKLANRIIRRAGSAGSADRTDERRTIQTSRRTERTERKTLSEAGMTTIQLAK